MARLRRRPREEGQELRNRFVVRGVMFGFQVLVLSAWFVSRNLVCAVWVGALVLALLCFVFEPSPRRAFFCADRAPRSDLGRG